MAPTLASEATTRSDVPVVLGGPERLFGVAALTMSDNGARAEMTTGPWLDVDGVAPVGAAGVLFDDALGYAILSASRPGDWSVSSEIVIEVLGRMPTVEGSRVHAEAELVHVDAIGGLAEGQLLDDRGRVIARGSQRGRFIPHASPDTAAAPLRVRHVASDLAGLLGARTLVDESGLHLELEAGRTLRNPLGIMHGGVSLCASEYAAILALKDTPGPALTTASVHMIYARPIAGGADVRFTATVLRRSRGLAVVDVTGFSGGTASTFARITAQPAPSGSAM